MGRAVEVGVRREVGEEVKVSKSKIKVQALEGQHCGQDCEGWVQVEKAL